MGLDELNALSNDRATGAFTTCCASARWARAMAEGRPFPTMGVLMEAAERAFVSLGRSDWLEAFGAHPRIGDRPRSGLARGPAAWSASEQAGVTEGSRAVFERRNRDYEARFGYTFIVCATGRSGDEMLQILDRRMLNNPDDELREAAAEQRQITRLRLGRLLT